jgi:hypothetical protein
VDIDGDAKRTSSGKYEIERFWLRQNDDFRVLRQNDGSQWLPAENDNFGGGATFADNSILTDYGWQSKLVCLDGKRPGDAGA